MPASRQGPLPPLMFPPSEQVEKISKFFRFLRDEKTLSFLRLLTHGGRAMPASGQPTSAASMSPASEQVEKISKFFRFLRHEKTLSFLRLLIHGGRALFASRQAPPPAYSIGLKFLASKKSKLL